MPAEPTGAGAGSFVLVVDDDPTWSGLVALRLRGLGCVVAVAESVDAAIVALERGSFRLVLSDQSMPGATGLDLLSYVTRRDPTTRFVLMSADVDDRLRGAAHAAGAAAVVDKDDLLAELRRILAADLVLAA
jgi:two-component system chemotaxis response regulator CheY